jgi:tRNA-dihydrouridine synthase C
MEGVLDHEMRDVLTQLGGYDRCVTEFVRVNNQTLPERSFLRIAPELEQGGSTTAGTPVYLQLLGSNPKSMARNAVRSEVLEPPGIDLNFGCPSKTVNKSEGGSALLREPDRIYHIVAAVRDAVDPKTPVTAKIRLGFSDHDSLHSIADNIFRAGANELCIHARTREDRYIPPAYWSVVKQIAEISPIPVIINGEIWSSKDAKKARLESGCVDIMLGRAALTFPDLAASIKAENKGASFDLMNWPEVLQIMLMYLQNSKNKHPKFVSNRAKQWLVFLQKHYSGAVDLFHLIKRLKTEDEVFTAISNYQASYQNQTVS